jgi:hypothetical protein
MVKWVFKNKQLICLLCEKVACKNVDVIDPWCLLQSSLVLPKQVQHTPERFFTRVGLQTLDQAEKSCQEQTLYFMMTICKLLL